MQREALIILAAVLTVAVLAAGSAPEQAADISERVAGENDTPVAAPLTATERDRFEHQFGPLRLQVVGAGGENSATLTMSVDVAI